VEALLRRYAEAEGPLDRPAVTLPTTTDQPLAEQPGALIGPYKLLEPIGEGGFGVVFMAEQQQPVRRKVALKVLKPGMDTRQIVARFEAERQALALMDHPNIAKVLDAGTTGVASASGEWREKDKGAAALATHHSPLATTSGRPYFVMELVKGVPITDYCDQCSLTTRERLDLFLSVCQAVQHAHQKGIIHRDIKPSNVLVAIQDGQPTVKVIDFGVAKAINQRLSEHTLETGFHQLIGTPLYMSPEQAEMSPLEVDTRADIYALGVLLYELLTGTTPFEKERLKEASYDELRRIVREEEPPRPSARLSTLKDKLTSVAAQRRTEPRQLLHTVRGELDWIVMKALEKDRNRRYESASAFAADVRRYLHDEPVQACPPSAGYRLRKFARRNKRALATAALLGVMLLAAVGARLQSEAAAKEKLERNLYFTHIALAERNQAASNVAWAEELLDQCPSHLRGWEWHFLKRQRYGNRSPLGHPDTVFRVAFSPDGREIASGCLDGTVKVWDAETGRELHTLQGPTSIIRSVVYSPDGRHLAVARNDGAIGVWNAVSGEKLRTLRGHKGTCWQVAFRPDGQALASAGADQTVRVWDVSSGQPVWVSPEHPAVVKAVAFRAPGCVVSACDDGTVKVWDLGAGRETFAFRRSLPYPHSAWFSADARRLGWSCQDGIIKVWDTTTGQEEIARQSHTHHSRCIAFSPDGRRIALAGFDRTIRLLDASTGQEALTIYGHDNLVSGVAFSPDGNRLASCGYDHTVRIWDATPLIGDPQAPHCVTITGHRERVSGVAFSPDSRWLASASSDGTVKIWDMAGLESAPSVPRFTLQGHGGNVTSVAFAPDGRTLASGSWDESVKVWDLAAENQGIVKPRLTIAGGAG
jgi:WD40 repeat protein/serine/threonine protein kinase